MAGTGMNIKESGQVDGNISPANADPAQNITAQQMAFGLFIKRLRDELERRALPKMPSCFISYAWEKDVDANKQLQQQLMQLRQVLTILKVDVKLDIRDMDGHIETYMADNIAQSDFILFIGTPRFKERASDVATNNLAFEVREALKKDPSTLVPLWYKGNRIRDAFPDIIAENLVRDFRCYDNFINIMTQVDTPVGLIPSLFQLRNDREYESLLEGFKQDLQLIKDNRLDVHELNKRSLRLEATTSVHRSSLSVSRDFVAEQQVIETTLADHITLDKQATFNISGMIVEGVSVELEDIRTEGDIEVVTKNLKNIIEAKKIASGFKHMTIADNAKVDATNAKSKGVSFKFKFATTSTSITSHTYPAEEAKVQPEPLINEHQSLAGRKVLKPLSQMDVELKTRVKTLLNQDYPESHYGADPYHQQVTAALAQFSAHTSPSQRKLLRQELESILKELQEEDP